MPGVGSSRHTLGVVAFLLRKPPWRRAMWLFAGMIPALLPTICAKLFLPAPSQLVTGQTTAGVLAKIGDVLDLKVDLGFAAILPDSLYDDVIKRIFKCYALRLKSSSEFARKSTD